MSIGDFERMADEILHDFDNGVLTITLNRPDRRNAMNSALCDALAASVMRAAADNQVRSVLLTGAAETFCVGGDVGGMASSDAQGREPEPVALAAKRLRGWMEAARLLHEMPKPTVAAIEGAAAGAGLSIALACDFRVVSRTAKLTTAFARVGLSGDYGGTWFLTRLVGSAKARDLYMLPRVMLGDEAERLGLVSRLVDEGTAKAKGQALARELADGPIGALGAIKANLNDALTSRLDDLLDAESARHSACARTPEHREAVAAFVQKRSAVYR